MNDLISYKIYLIRHGMTTGNMEGRYIGSTNLPLCEQGAEELEKLKVSHAYPEVQKVYTSPLQRCLDTAEILYPDRMIHVLPNLREYEFGKFEGKSIEDLKTDEEFVRWSQSGMKIVPEGAEDMKDFICRCEAGLNEVVTDMMHKRITEAAVITHGGVIMNLLGAHGYPKREPLYWITESGHGYTALLNAQLWQRDQVLEVFDPLPYPKDANEEPTSYQIFDLDRED
ncbi:MAG: histidine phosphatase family protein [Oscillospiraceae bacterium]